MNEFAPVESKPAPRSAYLAAILLTVGQALIFGGLLAFRAKFLRVIGPAGTGLLLAAFLLPVLLPAVAGVGQRRRPGLLFAGLRRLDRVPGLLGFTLIAGALALLAGLFFWSLIAVFINPAPFVTGLFLAYAGLCLLLGNGLALPRRRQLGQQLVLMLVGVAGALIITEVGLRLLNPFPTYMVQPPNVRWEYYPNSDTLPGVYDRGVYSTDANGFRGDPYQPDGRYNLLAIGGSTTEGSLLDNSEAWPYLLQQQLNEAGGAAPVWIGNVGRSGHGLVEHIHVLEFLAPQYELDAIVLLVGINDFTPVIQQPEAYGAHYEDPENYAYYLHRSFFARPLVDGRMDRPFPQNTAVWNLTDVAIWGRLNAVPRQSVFNAGDAAVLTALQARIIAAPLRSELPDLTPALRQYRQNLARFLASARVQNLRVVFATQPYVWHEDMSPEIARLLWFGFVGTQDAPAGRYDQMALAAGLDRFNQLLLDFCREEQVECVDLAAAMNGQEVYFYDDVHLNEAGSRRVAELLAAHFQEYGWGAE